MDWRIPGKRTDFPESRDPWRIPIQVNGVSAFLEIQEGEIRGQPMKDEKPLGPNICPIFRLPPDIDDPEELIDFALERGQLVALEVFHQAMYGRGTPFSAFRMPACIARADRYRRYSDKLIIQ